MKMLFLDDDDIRHSFWKKEYADHEVFCAHTIDEFSHFLMEHEFDVVSLDHDLNDHPKYASVANKGKQTVYLNGKHAAIILTALRPERRPVIVHIHSWNKIGAAQMDDILRENGYITNIEPFSYDDYMNEGKLCKAQGITSPIYDSWSRLWEKESV